MVPTTSLAIALKAPDHAFGDLLSVWERIPDFRTMEEGGVAKVLYWMHHMPVTERARPCMKERGRVRHRTHTLDLLKKLLAPRGALRAGWTIREWPVNVDAAEACMRALSTP